LNKPTQAIWDVLTSLKLTIVCLALLMVLVIGCTLAQVSLGTWGAVEVYMRAWIVWSPLPGVLARPFGLEGRSFPVFPGGALVGLVLMFNLVAAQVRRMELSWKKSGLWIVHAGLVLLFIGEFITGVYQVDSYMEMHEGGTVNFVESHRQHELVVTDVTDPAKDEVYGMPEGLLARSSSIALPGTPLTINVKRFFRNAQLSNRAPQDPASPATMGIGPSVTGEERPAVANDDEINATTAYVEPVAGGKSYGTWLVSNVLGAPQSFTHEGRTYQLAMRSRRWYLPYSVTLKEFSHDVYEGTQIPKNFSSLVQLKDPTRNEDREVLIFMNQPLRYDGKAFYQSSFKGDTVSNVMKAAKVATGLEIKVPMFIKEGDKVRVDTRTMEYVERYTEPKR
jgi:hypothetical protein